MLPNAPIAAYVLKNARHRLSSLIKKQKSKPYLITIVSNATDAATVVNLMQFNALVKKNSCKVLLFGWLGG
jgi:hypothetical protein